MKRSPFNSAGVIAASYIACFAALSWTSHVYPWLALGITPWNPAAALHLVLLLVAGLRFAPALFPAALLGQIVGDGQNMPLIVQVLSSLVLCLGYTAIAWLLARVFRIDPRLGRQYDVAVLVVVVLLAVPVIGVADTELRAAAGLVEWESLPQAVLAFWIGDVIGILAFAPLLLVLSGGEARKKLRQAIGTPEFALQMLTIIAVLWITCVLRQQSDFRHRYLMFLPLIWMAARMGIAGAATGTFLLLFGLAAGTLWVGAPASRFTEIHWLIVALTLTGLFLGIAVDERERALGDLKQSMRLAAAAETAGALAHELNQPLTALANYSKACALMLGGAGDQRGRLAETVTKIEQEAARAGAVVQQLREFLRNGTTRLAPVATELLVESVCASFRERARRCDIVLTTRVAAGLELLLVDRTQIEIALGNLLSNAQDSIVAAAAERRNIEIEAEADGPEFVRISVRDSGPGIAPGISQRMFAAFASSKESGMGLGLTLSRAIIEAHGGRLWTEAASGGIFHFTLPFIEKQAHASRSY